MNDSGNSGSWPPPSSWDTAIRAGDFAAAWAISDAVLAARDPATRDDPSLPYHRRWVWDGSPVDGRRVIVRCYHGLGDTIQFARYLRPLRQRAAHVTLEVQPELAALLHGMADETQPFDLAHPLPPAETDVEIMELAHALRLAPDPAPYLHARPARHGAGRVGLCWQAGGWDTARSIPPQLLTPLLALPLISLQRGPAAADLPLPDPLSGAMEVAEVAALITGLYAVITVDTMIAHLAAALGRPTFVLLRHGADWRWGDSDRTPWYATARLLRQPAPGVWDGLPRQALACLDALRTPGQAPETFPTEHVEATANTRTERPAPCESSSSA